ncbi:MAG: class I SAM-dependent methyltransferase [Promethearchaeota archaeon]|nr:MAG: hypothetical protein DRQ57_01915 [Gammaproteobacteria bacterium]
MINNYQDYFKEHYNCNFSIQDTNLQMNFLYSQLQYSLGLVNKPLTNQKVLEVGSGMGALAKLILQHDVSKYIGLELDKDIVDFCNQNISNNFINLSLTEYILSGKEKFDLIFAFEVLEHFENPLEEITNIYNLLNDKGIFIGTSPYPFKKNVLADETHLYVLHPLNWKRLFEMSGFSEVKIYPMTSLPYIWRINKKFNIIFPFYFPVKHFISTTLIVANRD